jgi:U4/U6 small nuclear ribonucleoprotein PRP31
MAESSLAADLLADFNESENEDEDFGIENKASHSPEPSRSKSRDFLELDGDEEEVGSEDEEMGGVFPGATRGESDLADDDDEEARKAKVEKMQLGGVDDVRSVAGLMKVLEPVLEVCVFYIESYPFPLLSLVSLSSTPLTLMLTFHLGLK